MALTGTSVAALSLCLIALVDASARVDGRWLADNITISNQLAEVLAYKARK